MLYIYQCQICGNEIEKIHSIKDEPFSHLFCAHCCRKTPVKRLICKGTSFVLKGDGWAKNGYQKKSQKKLKKVLDKF